MSAEEGLINLIHSEVFRALHRSTRRTPVQVDAYDPKLHAVKLKLMPESMDGSEPVVTGWVPLHPVQTGNNFGWHAPPNINDHGWLEFSDFDREGGTFTHAVFNDKFKPIQDVQAGELKYRHKTGTLIYFDKNGNVTITGKNNTNANGGTNTAGTGSSQTGTGQDNSKQTFILKSDGSVYVQDSTGNANIELKNGNITMNCVNYTVNASGDAKIIAAGNALFRGAAAILYAVGSVFIKAASSVNVKATTANLADPTWTNGAADPPITS